MPSPSSAHQPLTSRTTGSITPPAAAARRVAILCDAAPGRNGVGTYYSDLAAQLRPHLDEVLLLSPDDSDQDIRHWMSVPLPGDHTQKLSMPSPIEVHRRLRKVRPDVLIVASPGPYGLMGRSFAKRMQVPVIFGLHTLYDQLTELYWNRWVGGISRRFMASLDRQLVQSAHTVIGNSESMVAAARSLGAKRARLLGTLLPSEFLATPQVPCRPQVERVLFVGRLAGEKRIDRVIAAAKALPQVVFEVIGDGPLRHEVCQADAEVRNLIYRGWQPRHGVLSALDRCDLLVLPSDIEAFGTVALEAMSRARVPLVSARCGIVDWPELAAGVYAFSPEDTLADALRRITALTAEERCAKAERAQNAAQQMNQRTLEAWLSTLHSVARSTP